MAKDATYQPGVYRSSGGDQLNISSGGVLKFESGGTFTLTGQAVNTTGAGTFDSVSSTGSSGTIAGGQVAANLGFKPFVQAVTSSAATLTAYGVSHLKASTTLTMPLAAPSAGLEKWISVVTTGATVTITSSSGGADLTTAGSTQISITTGTLAAPSWIHLIGRNSTTWDVLGQSANVTVS